MNDNTKSNETKDQVVKTAKTVGLAALGVLGVAATLALGCVSNAVASDIGHDILDLF